MEAEYRISIEGPTAQTFIVTLSKVNIDPKGYIVADFEGRSLPALIAKASAWITNDVTHPEPWCRECDRPKDDCACETFAAPACSDCPPVGYPTNKTRCVPCPRRLGA